MVSADLWREILRRGGLMVISPRKELALLDVFFHAARGVVIAGCLVGRRGRRVSIDDYDLGLLALA